MRKLCMGLALVLALVTFGCSGGGGDAGGPDPRFAEVTEMLGKGWEMSASEREAIEANFEDAKKFDAAGKKAEVDKALEAALAKLEIIKNRHQLNNSE